MQRERFPVDTPQDLPDPSLLEQGQEAGHASPPSSVMTVVAEGLSKSFRSGQDEIRAVDTVSFTFTEGQFVAVLGKSGSGKSTLLYLLGGLDKPNTGELLVDGVDVIRLSAGQEHQFRREKLGFVFQSFHLLPGLTALENVMLPMELKGGMTNVELRERATALLKQVGVDVKRHQHKPGKLSGGQQQRVAIARALANDPRVILADEPTGNVDSHTGKIIIHLLKQLAAQGRTVIVVTHDSNIARVADVRLQMEDGKIKAMTSHAPPVASSAAPRTRKRTGRKR